MAQRTFTEKRHSLEKKVVDLFAHITFGTTGAPTLDTANSKGVASVSRTSAGLFVITLSDKYVRFLNVNGTFKVAAASFPAAPFIQLAAESVASAKTVTLQFANAGTPAATDPANGEGLYLTITLADSSAY